MIKDMKIHTKVHVKLFKVQAKIEKEVAVEEAGNRYVYQVSCKGSSYILKGFRIPLTNLPSEAEG
jgi:hypothetical protein